MPRLAWAEPDVRIVAAPQPTFGATETFERQWYNQFAPRKGQAAQQARFTSRFDDVAQLAALSPAKLAAAFAQPQTPSAPVDQAVASADPLAARFADVEAPAGNPVMAYAAHLPTAEGGALAAISALAETEESDVVGLEDLEASEDDAASLEQDVLPAAIPLPGQRPGIATPERSNGQVERTRPPEQRLAFAKPDSPAGQAEKAGIGRAFKDMFGARRAGNGVAVYDISAAKVYMPDGSVLEAHSGIGKMADNPRYTHVRMNGPTPAHTYNLKMRETRFHGVEAIRMLPVDGRNKFGRDGFLTHSYLLRGGRAESHGCVAFKDYKKFLTAYKQGKVRQLVVVPGGGWGASVNVARNDARPKRGVVLASTR